LSFSTFASEPARVTSSPVQKPSDAERNHHFGVPAAPGQAIQALRNVCFDFLVDGGGH
jgi:hypothetical protein